MKKKTKIIISVAIFIVLIVAILIIIFWPRNQEKSYSKKETIELISNGFANGISKKELEDLMNQKLSDKMIMTGEDAYLLQTPSDELIDKYNLDDYVKANKMYFNNLENKIKGNYSWKFTNDVKDNQDIYIMSVKTYSYGVYLIDVEELVNRLLENYPFENAEEQESNEYKARVVAMKLLNNYLDNYVTSNNPVQISISFKTKNSEETKNSLIQYLNDLLGYTNWDTNITNMQLNRPERVQEYINTALTNGTLNQNDILTLNN